MKSQILRTPFFYIITLFLFLFLIGLPLVQAQTISPGIMQMVTGELQKRGLTESEVRIRLLQKGIDLENIPPTELPQYQSRITAVLDELEAEKKDTAKSTAIQPININVGSTIPTTIPTVVATSSLANQIHATPTNSIATKQEAAAAFQREIQTDASKKGGNLNIYGHSLFTDQSLDVFRTTDGAQAPDTYVLGEGDEIHITIFGASQTDIQKRISSDGSIQPTGTSKIFLKGLSLAQARELIKKSLSTSYLFRSDQLAVTIVTARTIMVNVFGEAKITGGFNLSALNSAFNALSAAGGPTNIGSVRSIQLIRGSNRKTIDLYTFMDDPAVQFKFDLQNNDILFVPTIKHLVTIEGAVNRPMSYEMLSGETLTDLIHYAGGLKMNVYPNFVQIKRYVAGEERLIEWNLEEVQNGRIKVPLMNGDVVHIKAILKPMDQYVDIEGSVYYPGRFDLSANPSLSSLLTNAKPTYQAKNDILFIDRMRPDSTFEMLSVPFPNIKEGVADFSLKARDIVRIMDKTTYRDVDTIEVGGYVRKPFTKIVSLSERITVKNAIEMAGGLRNSVYPVAYIFRRNLFNHLEMKYIRIELSHADNIELQAGDKLNIYDNSTFTNVGEIRVFGAVKNPSKFIFDESLSIRDLLTNAGGFNVGAALNRVEVFRTILSPYEKTQLKMITLQVDSNYQVVSPKNFTLQPYDQIVVRLIPEFTLGRTVELSGQVKYPGTYILESKETKLSDVIKMAGGLLDDADPYGASLFRTYKARGNISMNINKAMIHKGDISQNPILFEGDVININRLENTVSILQNGTRMAQYSINKDGGSIKNVVFQGQRSAAWYIRNFAGGFQKDVDRNSVTITFPNNQMQSTKRFLFFRNYPKVVSGSTITMQMKPSKEVSNVNKKVDWDAMWSKTLSATTTALTLFLLMKQLGL